jgi:hypothetical protein
MCKLAKRLGDPTDRDEALQELHQALRHADGDAADEAFEAFFAAFVDAVFLAQDRPASTSTHIEAALGLEEPFRAKFREAITPMLVPDPRALSRRAASTRGPRTAGSGMSAALLGPYGLRDAACPISTG